MTTFDDFWTLYPRRVSKRAALKAWDKEMKAGTDPEMIILGLRRQLPILARKEEQFIPHAATWLNQGRFEDEVTIPQRVQPRIEGGMADFMMTRRNMTNARTIDAEYAPAANRGPSYGSLEGPAGQRRH